MIPIKDVIPPRSKPVATIGILVLGALVFVAEVLLGETAGQSALDLFANMLCLWIFADNVEDRMGHVRFAMFYILCGVAAIVVHRFVDPATMTPAVVSSGAVAGVLGSYLVLYPRSRVLMFFPIPLTLVEVPALFLIGLFAALHLRSGPGPLAEIGSGFLAGASLCLAFRRPLIW